SETFLRCMPTRLPVTLTLSLHDALPICERELDAVLVRIQNDLFDVEAELCLSEKGPGGACLTVTDVQVDWLESEVDRLNADLAPDRKSTRLNSSHEWISYAVFCLKKKTR